MALLCGCAEHNDREQGVKFLDSSKDIQAVHIRQPEIQNHDSNLSPFDFAQGILSRVYCANRVSSVLQKIAKGHTDVWLIVHNEHARKWE
jgi:hypothetical protein